MGQVSDLFALDDSADEDAVKHAADMAAATANVDYSGGPTSHPQLQMAEADDEQAPKALKIPLTPGDSPTWNDPYGVGPMHDGQPAIGNMNFHKSGYKSKNPWS